MQLNEEIKATFKDAAQKLTGSRKREFMAKVAEDYLEGSARKAERVLGWKRQSVELGLNERRSGLVCVDNYRARGNERRSGLVCVDNYRARGRHKSEEVLPQLETDMRALVEGQTQADPKFQSMLCYTRISARAVRETLIHEKGYTDDQLPTRQTIGDILNRLGYRLKKLKKRSR